MNQKANPIPCPHSPSCFTCPMRDCVINSLDGPVALINALPTDFERRYGEKGGQP